MIQDPKNVFIRMQNFFSAIADFVIALLFCEFGLQIVLP